MSKELLKQDNQVAPSASSVSTQSAGPLATAFARVFRQFNTVTTMMAIARLVALPLIMFFYLSGVIFDVAFFAQIGKLVALILFLMAATSQLASAKAREKNQITDAGKIASLISNRLLMLVGLILVVTDIGVLTDVYNPSGFIFSGFYFLPMPIWFAVLVLFCAIGRDIVVSGVRLIAAQKGVKIASDKFGRGKNILQYVAISLLMFYAFADAHDFFGLGNTSAVLQIYEFAAVFVLGIATAVCVISSITYLYNNRELYVGSKEKKNWGENKKEGEK